MMKDVRSSLEFRHRCMRFDSDREIPSSELEAILEAARLTPSSMGMEHWKFVVVRDPALIAQLTSVCMDQLQVATADTVVVILAKRYVDPENPYTHRMLERVFGPELVEPYKGLVRTLAETHNNGSYLCWSEKQCYLAGMTIMLAAASMGVDSCPMEGFDKNGLLETLKVDPERYGAALVIPLGYRVDTQPERKRLTLEEIVEWRGR